MAAHARDVNIFIWTSRKSIVDGTNDRVMVHSDDTRADRRRSKQFAQMNQIVGSRDGLAARSIVGSRAMWYTSRPLIWPVPLLKRLKRKFIL